MSRKRNNSQWICDRLEELLEKYENEREDTYDFAVALTYDEVLDDIESILYEQ